jgi:hypothetical protein
MPSRRHSSEMFSSPRSPSSTMRIYRILPTHLAPDVLQHLFCRRFARSGFLSHLRSLRPTMNQKSSLRKVPHFVSGGGDGKQCGRISPALSRWNYPLWVNVEK